jgi:hypothetical protein
MPFWIAGIVICILLGLGGMLACRSGASAAIPNRQCPAGEIARIPDSDLDAMLARLEREIAPEPTSGAMCYSPMALPDSTEYVCPVCGERTLYEWDQAYFLQFEIGQCREYAAAIDSSDLLDAVLDESAFCSHCSPGVEHPSMRLTIRYPDGSEVVNDVTLQDLTVLKGFLSGELFFVGERESTEPLRPHLDRIRQLLGR